MSQSNPFLNNPERASYELAYLLRELPRHLTREPLTDEQVQMMDAAEMQACNYGDALTHGLEAIGRVMWTASANEENEISARDIGHIGVLVSELAVQIQFLSEFRSAVLDCRDKTMKKGARK
jgi:hypothetical protein